MGKIRDLFQGKPKSFHMSGIELLPQDGGGYADYEIIPYGYKGVYKVIERRLDSSEEDINGKREILGAELRRAVYRPDTINTIERQTQEYENASISRVLIISATPDILQRVVGDAAVLDQFRLLVSDTRIRDRIEKSRDQVARDLYSYTRGERPGHIGALVATKNGEIGRSYNVKKDYDVNLAQRINKEMLEEITRKNRRSSGFVRREETNYGHAHRKPDRKQYGIGHREDEGR
jgi:predicted nucleotidyltransferase